MTNSLIQRLVRFCFFVFCFALYSMISFYILKNSSIISFMGGILVSLFASIFVFENEKLYQIIQFFKTKEKSIDPIEGEKHE